MRLTQIERNEICKYIDLFPFATEMKGKTFLITGCKGLVGQGLTRWLLLENELHNVGLDIIASTRNPNEIPEYIEDNDQICFCEFGKEKEFIKGKHIDYIIHAASPTGNSFHKLHSVESLRIIIDETEKMLDICNLNKKCSMVFLSSEEVYGLPDKEESIGEKYVGAIDSLATRSCYPLGKKTAELMCYTNSVEYGTDVKILRPTVIHGLFQRYSEERVVNEILRCVIESKDLVMKSDGSTKKCMMYSLDAISAILVVLFKGAKGEAYNASNPDTFMTVKDLANHVFSMFNPKVEIKFEKQDTSVALGYLPKRSLKQNIDKLHELGWSPMTGIDYIYRIDIQRFTNDHR